MRFAYIGRFDKPWNEEGIATTLEGLGHTVTRMDEQCFELRTYQDLLPQVDVVLWAKLRIKGNALHALNEARAAHVKTVCWVFDLYWGLSRAALAKNKDPMWQADLVCSTDGGHAAEFAAAGINHRLLRQGILPQYAYRAEHTIGPRIVFVGARNPEYPYRDAVLKRMDEWYGSARVCMGDSVYSPEYWSNRVYETIGRGGLLVHPAVPGLEREFTPYKHYIPYPYKNWAYLREALDYYTNNWAAGEAIRQAGFEHCKAHHTFTHRCEQLVQYINEL
jgi:hypothetical protein